MYHSDVRPLYLAESLLFHRYINTQTDSLLTTIQIRQVGPRLTEKYKENTQEDVVCTMISQTKKLLRPEMIARIRKLEKTYVGYHNERTYIANTWIYHGEKQATIKAKTIIKAGTFLHEIQGLPVPLTALQAAHAKKHKYDFSIMQRTSEGNTDVTTAQMMLGVLRLVNHACKSYNAEYYYTQHGTITLRVIRTILENEDILVQYADEWTPDEDSECICRDHVNCAFDTHARMRPSLMLDMDMERERNARRRFMLQQGIREYVFDLYCLRVLLTRNREGFDYETDSEISDVKSALSDMEIEASEATDMQGELSSVMYTPNEALISIEMLGSRTLAEVTRKHPAQMSSPTKVVPGQ